MNELMNSAGLGSNHRPWLLATASSFAIVAYSITHIEARAADTETAHPSVWIELGGQFERSNSLGDKFDPPFLQTYSESPVIASGAPFDAQDSRFSYGEEGKISYQPEGSAWVFGASLRYGRASSRRHIHQSKGVNLPNTSPLYNTEYTRYGHHTADNRMFSDTVSKSAESHTLLDFQAGKDFGLGMFGSHASANVSFGVRFAQFSSQRDVSLRARPDLHFYNGFFKYWHTYGAHEMAKRSFHGVGPSISLAGAIPVAASNGDDGISLDWGVNGAVLFGRQKANVHHNSTAGQFHPFNNPMYSTYYPPTMSVERSRMVTVPNLGAFGGVSVRYSAAKLSFGYRADFFFGAMDAGNDVQRSQTTRVYGPFATVSVGLGG